MYRIKSDADPVALVYRTKSDAPRAAHVCTSDIDKMTSGRAASKNSQYLAFEIFMRPEGVNTDTSESPFQPTWHTFEGMVYKWATLHIV